MFAVRVRRAGRVCATALGWLVAVALSAETRFHNPAPGARLSAGETVTAAWSVPCDRREVDETELVLSLDGGITFPIRVSRSLTPCATSYAWRVPEVATGNARLGLREGREGQSETERIVLVSGAFSMVQTGGSPSSDLTRGAIEWWTDQALFDVAAEDWLGASLGRPPTCRAGAESESDADEPGPELSSLPYPERESLRAAAPPARAAAAHPTVPRLPAPVPLRV